MHGLKMMLLGESTFAEHKDITLSVDNYWRLSSLCVSIAVMQRTK